MQIETLTAAEATEILRGLGVKITPTVLREGLMDRRYPFGECFQTGSGSVKCTIYKRLLDAWISERATGLPDVC